MMKSTWNKLYNFFKKDLWAIPYNSSKPFFSFFVSLMRVIITSVNGFIKDDCYLKSSALTFYSLLSIVPVLAVAFGIAKGFGYQQTLESEILVQFKEQPIIAHRIIDFSYSLLEHAKGGLIAGVGVISLFWTVLKLLENIEVSLNSIWKIPVTRPWSKKFTDYFAMMIFCPFFFVISGSLTIYVTTQVENAARHIQLLDYLSPIILFSFQALPYLFSWILFSFLYLFMPNTKVSWKAGIGAGIIAGTAYQILQVLYIKFQIGVSSYGAIYGSFAALPLFLIWLNVSWMIVLAGAEISYQIQQESYDNYNRGMINKREQISRQKLALWIVFYLSKRFQEGTSPVSLDDLSQHYGLSPMIIDEILKELIQGKIIVEAFSTSDNYGYQPAQDLNQISLKQIFNALDPSQRLFYSIISSPELTPLDKAIHSFDKQSFALASNLSLKELTSDRF